MQQALLFLLLSITQVGFTQLPNPQITLKERGMICPTNNGLAKAWWQRANDEFAGGAIEPAILFFRKSIATDSTFCDPQYGLSILYFAMGKTDSAEIFAKNAYLLHPDSEKLQFNLASVWAARVNFQDAIPLLETLSKTEYKKAETLQLLSQMLLFAEKHDASIATAKESLALCETSDPYLAGLNFLVIGSNWLWQKDPTQAKLYFEKALAQGVNVPESYRKAAGM